MKIKSEGGSRKAEVLCRSSFVRRRAACAALAAALSLGGCDYFGFTPIKEITTAPGQFEGKEVKIKGKAADAVQVLGMRAFTLKDESGEITVTTSSSLPAAGDDVAVQGTVKSTVIVGGKSLGLRVEETKRLR